MNVASGATVDLKGGGDIYAYEFISGIGGSRDVLSQFNSDSFSSNNGYQYPDGRQIYAIVPSLANAASAPFDPIYSANYSSLYGPSQVGERVYLNAAPGLAAGWYTLATPYDRPVEFTMPDDGAIHTLADLVNRGALITPRFPATTLPNFAFVHGGLALRNQTDGQLYRLSLGADLSVELQAPVSGAVAAPATPTARIEQGVLQFPDPAGALHSVTFSGTASAPMLSLGDATVTDAQRLRFTTTQLQLPNLDAGGYHALLLIQTAGGPQLAFGPNQA